jgi:hypothetical protein
MKHIIITTSDAASIDTMQGYSGVELVKHDADFAVWYCSGLSQLDIDAITGYNGAATVKLVGMLLLNVPQQEEQ